MQGVKMAEEILRQWYKMRAGGSLLKENGNPRGLYFLDVTDRIEAFLTSLPASTAEALRLLYFERLTREEAAEILSISRLRLSNKAYLALLQFCDTFTEEGMKEIESNIGKLEGIERLLRAERKAA